MAECSATFLFLDVSISSDISAFSSADAHTWRPEKKLSRMTTASPATGAAEAAGAATENHDTSMLLLIVAAVCLGWYFVVTLVQLIGSTQLYRYYSSNPPPACSIKLPFEEIPHVTILRPVKGLEPQLYECLAATFYQNYPREKLTIYFCVSTKKDPAYSVLQRLLLDFPGFDAKIFVEEEDPVLSGNGGDSNNLGPNPKIRNMSRGYREAKGDIIWSLDCNIWVGKEAAGRMVDKLCGFGPSGTRLKAYKFVHHLPLVVDSVRASVAEETQSLLNGNHDDRSVGSSRTKFYEVSLAPNDESGISRFRRTAGGRFEEMFMATSHAKFYTAINTVAIAPCILGKSNMFRRSHLDYLTSILSSNLTGIDHFSVNICEDHLIGDLLWRKRVPEEKAGEKWGKHALVFGDLAIQPMAEMSVGEYIARRVRWLRVRKWTVTLATLVEPGVESLLCSAYGALGFTTIPWFHNNLGIPQTWTAFSLLWLLSVTMWITTDRLVSTKLHSFASVELDAETPGFARPPQTATRRPFNEWFTAWIGREALALPIWVVAVLGGTTVVWKNKTFWVGMDMKVHEISDGIGDDLRASPEVANGRSRSKDRRD